MKKRTCFFYLCVLVGIVLLTGCPSGSEGVKYDSGTWVDKPGNWVEFTCNDPAKTGYAFFNTYATGAGSITGISAQMKRVSGAATAGYGLVICYNSPTDFYQALIITNGYYQVSKYTNSGFSYISGTTGQPWVYSANINQGFNIENTLKFVLDKTVSPPELVLYINNVKTFTADGDTSLNSGRAGFVTGITSDDAGNFPGTPVKVQFKKNEIDPALSLAAAQKQDVIMEKRAE